jgi:hypothetical protein
MCGEANGEKRTAAQPAGSIRKRDSPSAVHDVMIRHHPLACRKDVLKHSCHKPTAIDRL